MVFLTFPTVYKWHQDNDPDNNPSGRQIYRTLIVKLTEGCSVSVQVAGQPITEYGDAAGSYIDFRSDAVHRRWKRPL